jgi:hypothetical protein
VAAAAPALLVLLPLRAALDDGPSSPPSSSSMASRRAAAMAASVIGHWLLSAVLPSLRPRRGGAVCNTQAQALRTRTAVVEKIDARQNEKDTAKIAANLRVCLCECRAPRGPNVQLAPEVHDIQ